jgi:hypothetical protein
MRASTKDDGVRISWPWLISTILVTVPLIVGGTWALARAQVSDELRQYEQSKDWQLPSLLKDLRATSQRVNLQIDERRRYERLESSTASLSAQIASSRASVTALRAERDELKSKLAQLSAPSFSVQEGSARVLVPGRLAVGVKNVSVGEADIQFGGELRSSVSAGTTFEKVIGGTRYAVTLVGVNWQGHSCDFTRVETTAR